MANLGVFVFFLFLSFNCVLIAFHCMKQKKKCHQIIDAPPTRIALVIEGKQMYAVRAPVDIQKLVFFFYLKFINLLKNVLFYFLCLCQHCMLNTVILMHLLCSMLVSTLFISTQKNVCCFISSVLWILCHLKYFVPLFH